jgi:hypothetical protein
MLKIEYEIKLNDSGRPYIDLPLDYQNKPEDKFFVLELSRYVLQGVYNRRSTEFDSEAAKMIDITIRLLGQVSDEVAAILYGQMIFMGEMAMNLDNNFHIQVNGIEERDNLNEHTIVYDGKIFKRQEGLKVNVLTYDMETFLPVYDIYELKDGITNEHWVKL